MVVCATAGGLVVTACRLRDADEADEGREVGRGVIFSITRLLPKAARDGLVVVVVEEDGDISDSYSSSYSTGFKLDELISPPSSLEGDGAGVVARVGMVGFENRLKFKGLPRVVGLGVVVAAPDPAAGVDNFELSRNLLLPPLKRVEPLGLSVVVVGDAVDEEDPPFSYSYSSLSEYSDVAVGFTT